MPDAHQSVKPPAHLGGHNDKGTPSLMSPERWDACLNAYLNQAKPDFDALSLQFPEATALQIKSRSMRAGWAKKKRALPKVSAALLADKSPDLLSLITTSAVHDLAEVIRHGASILKHEKPMTVVGVKRVMDAAMKLLDVAKPVLGIGVAQQAQSGGLIRMEFMMKPENFMKPAQPAEVATIQPVTIEV